MTRMGKIPDGATHYGPDSEDWQEAFYRDNGDGTFHVSTARNDGETTMEGPICGPFGGNITALRDDLIDLRSNHRVVNPWIEHARRLVYEAQNNLMAVVQEQYPLDMLVDYQHGERWIGPCRVAGHGRCWWHGASDVSVVNLKTGKSTTHSATLIRPTEKGEA